MAQFNFESEVNDLLRLDAPISKGPQPRWQRKEDAEKSSTPLRNSSKLNLSTKTPGKTPKSAKKTPGKSKTPKTPSGDRFIPARNAINFDSGFYKVVESDRIETDTDENSNTSYNTAYQKKAMTERLSGNELNERILHFKSKAPTPKEGHMNELRVLYTQNKTPSLSAKKSSRHVPQVPERILDAPDLLDDYYLNLLDWSCNNHLAVALGGFVYLWNAATGDIQQLCQMESSDAYVSSLSYILEGNYLAVGDSLGRVQIWDVESQKRLRSMAGHAARVGSLSWNSYILSSGSRSGAIHNHDVRIASHHIGSYRNHTQEVCGLKWSPEGQYLASGGNDNLLCIWDVDTGANHAAGPVHTLAQHQAAVKALAWCPFQKNTLASGGGTADRHIRFWNTSTGVQLSAVDSKSQVCSLLWSKEYKELISSHGFAQNQLTIWKYPSLAKVRDLTGHTCRVLHMAMSPDGQFVMSAAADETLRLWKCFAVDKKKKIRSKATPPSAMARCIR